MISRSPSGSGFVTKQVVVYGLTLLTAVAGLSVGLYVWAGSAPACPEAVRHGGRQMAELTSAEKWLARWLHDVPEVKHVEVSGLSTVGPVRMNPKPGPTMKLELWEYNFESNVEKLKEALKATNGCGVGDDRRAYVVKKIRPIMNALEGHLLICLRPHSEDDQPHSYAEAQETCQQGGVGFRGGKLWITARA